MTPSRKSNGSLGPGRVSMFLQISGGLRKTDVEISCVSVKAGRKKSKVSQLSPSLKKKIIYRLTLIYRLTVLRIKS